MLNRKLKSLVALTFALSFLITGCASGQAEEEKSAETDSSIEIPDAIKTKGEITIGTREDSAPNGFVDENDNLTGYELDLMRAVAEELGLDLKEEVTTFDGIIPGLAAHRYDVAFGNMGSTLERQKTVDFVTTLEAMENIILETESKLSVENLDDLCGLNVGMARGSLEEKFADEQSEKCIDNGDQPVKNEIYQSGSDAYVALTAGRIDAVWSSGPKAKYIVDQSDGAMEIALSYPTGQLLSFVLPKDSELAEPIRKGMNAIISNGEYEKVLEKWNLTDMAIEESKLNPQSDPTV